jgi:putative restriction endonuclease
MSSIIERELARRLEIWAEFKVRGGPDDVDPQLIRQLRIHPGQQGIFRDLDVTSVVSGTPAGITVALRHTGTSYADDLSEDGIIYHYPETHRGGRDALEVAATKACGELGLPLFVIITPQDNPRRRNVRLGWVQDHDDQHGLVLILFSDTERPPLAPVSPESGTEDFVLRSPRSRRQAQVTARPNQTRFRFQVVKRYGMGCAVCEVRYPELLHAAHLCPVEENGADHPLNGLVFCLNHHRAFDEGLFCIEPESLEIRVRCRHRAPELGITKTSLWHLPQRPHPEALLWAWSARNKRLEE